MKTKQEPLPNLLKFLAKLDPSTDYHIVCRDSKAEILFLDKSCEKAKEKFLIHNCKLLVSIECASHKICITSRIQFIDEYSRYISRLTTLPILYRILKCCSDTRIYLFLDTYSDKFMYITYLVKELLENRHDWRFNEIVEYGLVLLEFKEIHGRIKDLEKKLKIEYDEKLFDEYQFLINKLDHIMPKIRDLWIRDRDKFDIAYSIIARIDKDLSDLFNEMTTYKGNYHVYLAKTIDLWKKEYIKLFSKYNVDPVILDTYIDLGITSEKIDEVFAKIIDFLKSSEKCGQIFLVDNEVYEFLVKKTRVRDVNVLVID